MPGANPARVSSEPPTWCAAPAQPPCRRARPPSSVARAPWRKARCSSPPGRGSPNWRWSTARRERSSRRAGGCGSPSVFAVEDGKIAEYTVIADPGRLRRLSVAVLG